MRIRLTLLLVAILLLAGFATLNWGEFVRPAQLSWGWSTAEAPLGLVLLALLALSWVGFLIGSAYLETHYQLAAHRNGKALEAQRALADKAEASRFTELRAYLESEAVLTMQREAASATRIENMLQRDQRERMLSMDRLNALLATYPSDAAPSAVPRAVGRTSDLSQRPAPVPVAGSG